VETTSVDAYHCCVACVLNPSCSFGALLPGGGINNCEIAEEPTCNPQTTYFYGINEVPPSGAGIQFFNGNCGEISEYFT
jgi:hypothetical protein